MYVKSTNPHSFNMPATAAFYRCQRVIAEAWERGNPNHTQGRYCGRRKGAGRAWYVAIIEEMRFYN